MKPAIPIALIAATVLVAGFLYLGSGHNSHQTSQIPTSATLPKTGASPRSTSVVIPALTTFNGLPPNANGSQLFERISILDHDIPCQEQSALLSWITGPKPDGISDAKWLHIVNEVMDKLCHQHQPLPELGETLSSIVRNPAKIPGVRDYALQHLVDWLTPTATGEPFETNPTKREAIIKTLIQAASETTENLAGTALLALHLTLEGSHRSGIAENTPTEKQQPSSFTATILRPLAVNLATTADATDGARETALQVCAEQGFNEILPKAREIATNTAFRDSLRLSAIAVIGQIGVPGDKLLLEQLTKTASTRLQKALQPALKNLQKRGEPSSSTASIAP